MRIVLEELEIFFPYDYIYPEQYAYMVDLKKSLDVKGHCLLEMPSGTGKTVTLLSLILAYQMAHSDKRKLIYCSRTVPEIEKTLLELKRCVEYTEKSSGKKLQGFLGLGLSARKNLCIHPEVRKARYGKTVDARCHSLTASFVREDKSSPKCIFYEGIEELKESNAQLLSSGVYSLEDLKSYGQNKGLCPYFLARRMIAKANVIVYSFHYLLDPKISELIGGELARESIVVFDEAHNIDNVCIESMSVDLTKSQVDSGGKCLNELSERVSEMRQKDSARLMDEYNQLVAGLVSSAETSVISSDVLEEAMPGNIRKAEHFISLLRRLIEFLRDKLRTMHVISESPWSLLTELKQRTLIESKPLRFCDQRLNSLLKTLKIVNIEPFYPLKQIAAFATICATYRKGFVVLLEPYDNLEQHNPVLHLSCLDASLAIAPVFKRFESVVITSGTLSPLEMYPTLLKFTPAIMKSYNMSLTRNCYCPLVVTRGSDQVAISSKFEIRSDNAVIRNFGLLLVEMSRVVPDGVVCFFPSYIYMEAIVNAWNEQVTNPNTIYQGFIKDVMKTKLVFIETPDALETSIALSHYRQACENGRGAVLLCVARGKVSEGIDFDHHYGRAVILFGIPYQYSESRLLKARLEFLYENYKIKELEFHTFDALRHAAQCLGRVLRGKQDYGLMILADKRYARSDKKGKLPRWIQQGLLDANTNLSTDMAVHIAKTFFRQMAQRSDHVDQIGISLWSVEDIEKSIN